jgi:ADP-heptose:LPS heptosyltransferase
MAAMKRCRMHLGNDTGTMHMAASVKVPCVGIFASAQPLGWWHPYGAGHRILERRIDCEGCLLEACVERAHECLLSITIEQVTEACVEMLTRLGAFTVSGAVEDH